MGRNLHSLGRKAHALIVELLFAAFVMTVGYKRLSRGGVSATHSEKPFIAVVTLTRSLVHWQDVRSTAIFQHLLPSLEHSVNKTEKALVHTELLVVYDKGDAFWERRMNRKDLLNSARDIRVRIFSVKRTSARLPFNEACRTAYELGADYIVRVNDDSEFITSGWVSLGIATLAAFDPPNVGVVGPTCLEGNRRILTHDMVHKTHLEVFDHYYPPEMENWWVDDWISSVYGNNRTKKLREWTVQHHTNIHGQRYKENLTIKGLLPMTVMRGRMQLQAYLVTHGLKYNTP